MVQAERAAKQADNDAAIRQRDAAISSLADCTDNVWKLWQQSLELATKHLPIGAAYVAAVADIEAGDPNFFLKEAPPAEPAAAGLSAETVEVLLLCSQNDQKAASNFRLKAIQTQVGFCGTSLHGQRTESSGLQAANEHSCSRHSRLHALRGALQCAFPGTWMIRIFSDGRPRRRCIGVAHDHLLLP